MEVLCRELQGASGGRAAAQRVASVGGVRQNPQPLAVPHLKHLVTSSGRSRRTAPSPSAPSIKISFSPSPMPSYSRSRRREGLTPGAGATPSARRRRRPPGSRLFSTPLHSAATSRTSLASATSSTADGRSSVFMAPPTSGPQGAAPSLPQVLPLPSALDATLYRPAVPPPAHTGLEADPPAAARPVLQLPGEDTPPAATAHHAWAGAYSAALPRRLGSTPSGHAEASAVEGMALAVAAGLTRQSVTRPALSAAPLAGPASWHECLGGPGGENAPTTPSGPQPAHAHDDEGHDGDEGVPPALAQAVLYKVYARIVSSASTDWATLFRTLGLGEVHDGDTVQPEDVEYDSLIPVGTLAVAGDMSPSSLRTFLPRSGVLLTQDAPLPLPAVDVLPSGKVAEVARAADAAGRTVQCLPPTSIPRPRSALSPAAAARRHLPSWAPPLPANVTGVSPGTTRRAEADWEHAFSAAYLDAVHGRRPRDGDAVGVTVSGTVADLLSDHRMAGMVRQAAASRLHRAWEHREALDRLRQRIEREQGGEAAEVAHLAQGVLPGALARQGEEEWERGSPPPPPPPLA